MTLTVPAMQGPPFVALAALYPLAPLRPPLLLAVPALCSSLMSSWCTASGFKPAQSHPSSISMPAPAEEGDASVRLGHKRLEHGT